MASVVEREASLQGPKDEFIIWSQVDYVDEAHVVKMAIFMKAMDMVSRVKQRTFLSHNIVNIPKDSMFPQNMKLQDEHCNAFIEHILRRRKLHPYLVKAILTTLLKILRAEPNMNDIRVPPHSRCTVVGDTHGQLSDVVYILKKQGPPSSVNLYVWNGDFVDRGPFGVEVFLIVACLKICKPNYVYLNRGNHESAKYNIAYGFFEEVRSKFEGEAGVFDLFQSCFNQLPLACRLNKDVLIVHGGLSRNPLTKIGHIRRINRNMEVPNEPYTEEEQIMQDLLWSDPCLEKGVYRNPRGVGCLFGPDMTSKFLKTNQLKTIVRSHECIEDGYMICHNDTVYTVFRASNYCGDAGNCGAFLVFSGGDGKELVWNARPLEIHTYMAPLVRVALIAEEKQKEEGKVGRGDRSEQLSILKKKLIDYVIRFHEPLEYQFTHADIESTGMVSVETWGDIMESVLHCKLPWDKIRRILIPNSQNTDQTVDYWTFLNTYSVHFEDQHGFIGNIIDRIKERVLVGCENVMSGFAKFDEDGDGSISPAEFYHVLHVHCPDLHVSKEQVDQIIRAIDKDGDGFVQFNEFSSAFAGGVGSKISTIVDNVSSSELIPVEEVASHWESRLKKQLLRMFYRQKSCLVHAFRALDESDSGLLSIKDFCRAIKALLDVERSVKIHDDTVSQLAKDMASYRDDATINYREFLSKFQVLIEEKKEGELVVRKT